MDELGHQVELPGGEAYDAIVQEFGTDILNPDLTIDRRKLASKVFSDPDRLARLNAMVHPAVRARAAQMEREFFAQHPAGTSVTEAAILIETGSYRDFDKLILAICSPEQQLERAMSRDGLTRAEALDRLARQKPLSEKMRYADYVIDTSGTKENTALQTKAVYEQLRTLNPGV